MLGGASLRVRPPAAIITVQSICTFYAKPGSGRFFVENLQELGHLTATRVDRWGRNSTDALARCQYVFTSSERRKPLRQLKQCGDCGFASRPSSREEAQ